MRLNAELRDAIATSFKPSEYYSPEVIEYAKKYLGKENWEENLKIEYMQKLIKQMGFFKYCFASAPEKRNRTSYKKSKTCYD